MLGLGQSSPVLEDWEGESAWVQVLALLWTVAWALAGRGHMRRGHSPGEEPSIFWFLDMTAPGSSAPRGLSFRIREVRVQAVKEETKKR